MDGPSTGDKSLASGTKKGAESDKRAGGKERRRSEGSGLPLEKQTAQDAESLAQATKRAKTSREERAQGHSSSIETAPAPAVDETPTVELSDDDDEKEEDDDVAMEGSVESTNPRQESSYLY